MIDPAIAAAEAARLALEERRWPHGPVCPACGEGQRIGARRGGYYRCNACSSDFTVRTGTILGRSKVPLHPWLHALHLLAAAPRGIPSTQLARQIGVTQKTAWLMLGRLREAEGDDPFARAAPEIATRSAQDPGLRRPQRRRIDLPAHLAEDPRP